MIMNSRPTLDQAPARDEASYDTAPPWQQRKNVMNINAGYEIPRATILIVDDTPQHMLVLEALLQPMYRVCVATSGESALEAVTREPRPDLILLDVMMPGMDGLEVLQCLRSSTDTIDIPVIFVTARMDEEDERRGFELGAADYIHKPIKGPIVLSRVRAQLDAKAARDMLKNNNLRLVNKVEEGTHALEQAQRQLLQSEKMAAMGQLAAGIVHEINNPISFVSSNMGAFEAYLKDIFTIIAAYERTEMLTGDTHAFAEVHETRQRLGYDFLKQDIAKLITESKDGISRVREIVNNLKNFSRVDDGDWQWADIHHGIDSTLNIVRNELKYHCTITKHYDALPAVWCLPSQLNQVFMNLLVNAGQAIEGKGEITITTMRDGENEIKISIADSGRGIAPDVMAHIFEPFFTTKPVGKGTGLGLSLSRTIVERHCGKIEAASEKGLCTTFTVTLPIRARSPTA